MMFGRKRQGKAAPLHVRVDGSSGVLYDGPITALSVPEPLIIQLSIEFFNDPEPCQIHRGAVLRRVFMELNELGEGTIQADSLDSTARRYLSAYPDMASVTIYRQEGG